MRGNVQFRAEIRDFVRFGFEVLVVEIPKHEIEHGDASADVFKFVLAAIAEILMADLPIDLPRKEMVDRAALREAVDLGMLAGLQLGPEESRALAPIRAGETREIAARRNSRNAWPQGRESETPARCSRAPGWRRFGAESCS